jgi:hypothetical protein
MDRQARAALSHALVFFRFLGASLRCCVVDDAFRFTAGGGDRGPANNPNYEKDAKTQKNGEKDEDEQNAPHSD